MRQIGFNVYEGGKCNYNGRRTGNDDVGLAGEDLLSSGSDGQVRRDTGHGHGGGRNADGDTRSHTSLSGDVGSTRLLDDSTTVKVVDETGIQCGLGEQTFQSQSLKINSHVVSVNGTSQSEGNSVEFSSDTLETKSNKRTSQIIKE